MQINQPTHFQWPSMVVSSSGKLIHVSFELIQFLRTKSISNVDDLSQEFEMFDDTGRLLGEQQRVWNRAAQDHDFETKQIWIHKITLRKTFLRIYSKSIEGGFLISFEDEIRDGLVFELANMLGEPALALIGVEDYNLIAHAIVEQISKALKTDIVYLAMPLPNKHLKVIASIGLSREYPGEQSSPPFEDTYHAEMAVNTGQIQQVGQIETLPPGEYPSLRRLLSFGLRSYAAVPLIWEGEALGVVSLARRIPGNLVPLEVTVLKSLALAGAIALKKSKVKQRERDTYFRVQTINSLILELESGQSLHLLLKDLVQRACDLTGARYGAMGVLNKEKTEKEISILNKF